MSVMARNDSACDHLHRLFHKFQPETAAFSADLLNASRIDRDVTWSSGGNASTDADAGSNGWLDDELASGYSSSESLDAMVFYLASVVNPALCVFGVIGNVFNVIVLSRGQIKDTLECSMELAAHTGLVALAVSDILYCVIAFMESVVNRHPVVFDTYGPHLYIRLYAYYLQNVFLHTGTWLTVVMAVARYAAICRPLQARHLIGVLPTRLAVLLTFVIWTLLDLPKIWTFDVVTVEGCPPAGSRYYILDQGPLVVHADLKKAFTYLWASIGFFVPVLLLSYCNVHLIRALRESIRVRRLYRVSSRATSPGSRISPTLIAIVFMYLVLIMPSELLQFYYYVIGRDRVEMFNVAIVVTNCLQTLNFAFNFVLYCIVNVHFRRTCFDLVYGVCCCRCFRSSSSLSPSTFGHLRAGNNRRSSSSTALRGIGHGSRLRRSWNNSSIGSNYFTREYCAVAHVVPSEGPVETDVITAGASAAACETAL